MPQGPGSTLLLVEDNRDTAEAIVEFLELRGHAVDYAGDGVTGLHLAVTNAYDAIILDVMLPGMDGIESAASCARKRAATRRS